MTFYPSIRIFCLLFDLYGDRTENECICISIWSCEFWSCQNDHEHMESVNPLMHKR